MNTSQELTSQSGHLDHFASTTSKPIKWKVGGENITHRQLPGENQILANYSIFYFCLKDIAHLHNRRWREIARQKCCSVASQPPGFHTFLPFSCIFIHISVFVGPDVSDGDLAHFEGGLSGGQTLVTLHRSMVEHTFCFVFWVGHMYFLSLVVLI